MKLWQHLLVITLITCLALVLRLYKIDTPLADWHSFRQADTASVTREFVKNNYSMLEPHYHDLSNIQSGFENPEGYRMVELPFMNYGIAQILKQFPELDLVVFSRLVSVFFSLLSVISLYLIVFLTSRKASLAIATSLIFSVLPYSVFYSRVILPEPIMVGWQLLSVLFFVTYTLQKGWLRLVSIAISIICLALALLLKPVAVFIAPVFAVIAIARYGKNVWRQPELYLFALAAIPVLWWRSFITTYPTGIPVYTWLLNGNGIRLKPAWWRWLFADRLSRLILGYWGVTFLITGIVGKLKPKFGTIDWLALAWLAGGFAYLVVFATGNVQHDYYQVLLTPIISLLVAKGMIWLLELPKSVAPKLVTIPAVLVVTCLMLAFSWYEVEGYYNINNPAIIIAGQRVDELTPPDAKIIAPYMGDTAFLFQTNRLGWPIGFNIEQRLDQGATHYVSTSYDDEARLLETQYQVIEKTADFILIDLRSANDTVKQ